VADGDDHGSATVVLGGMGAHRRISSQRTIPSFMCRRRRPHPLVIVVRSQASRSMGLSGSYSTKKMCVSLVDLIDLPRPPYQLAKRRIDLIDPPLSWLVTCRATAATSALSSFQETRP
jgi:hypothetical protein